MATATVTADVAKILQKNEDAIIKGWLQALSEKTDARISVQEVEAQARDFLRGLVKATEKGGVTDILSRDYDDVRALLSDKGDGKRPFIP